MAETIIFGQQKGGVGKTTDTVMTALTAALAFNKKTAVIDTDLQGNATSFLVRTFGADKINKTFMKCMEDGSLKPGITKLHENLDLIPSEYDTRKFGDFLNSKFPNVIDRTFYLSQLIDEIKDDYEYIFIDIPPSTDIKVDNAMVAADFIVVVQETQQFAFEGSQRLIFQYLQTLIDDFGSKVNLEIAGVLPVMLQNKRPLHKDIVEKTIEMFGNDNVFNTIINNHARLEYYPRIGLQNNDHHDKRMIALFADIFAELEDRIKTIKTTGTLDGYKFNNVYFKDNKMTDEGKKLIVSDFRKDV